MGKRVTKKQLEQFDYLLGSDVVDDAWKRYRKKLKKTKKTKKTKKKEKIVLNVVAKNVQKTNYIIQFGNYNMVYI